MYVLLNHFPLLQHCDGLQPPDEPIIHNENEAVAGATESCEEPAETQKVPYGSEHYTFDWTPEVEVHDCGNHEAEQIAVTVEEKHKEVLKLRSAIKDSWNIFTTHLRSAHLPASFHELKSLAGREFKICILGNSRGRVPRVMNIEKCIEEEVDLPVQCHLAVARFNEVLTNSFMFLQEAPRVREEIEEELRNLARHRNYNTQTQRLYNAMKRVPGYIESYKDEVKKLLHDVQVAESKLQHRPFTGSLLSLSG